MSRSWFMLFDVALFYFAYGFHLVFAFCDFSSFMVLDVTFRAQNFAVREHGRRCPTDGVEGDGRLGNCSSCVG